MITYNSITHKPANFEKCRVCGGQLPPNVPRLFTAVIPEDGPHKHSFRHLECPETGGASYQKQ